MKIIRASWWIFTLAGLIFGFFAALIYVGGAAEIWQYAGNPGLPIREIAGLAEQKFYVRAENNRIFSFEYSNWKSMRFTLPKPVEWTEEAGVPETILPDKDPSTAFIIWPPFFSIQQLYRLELPVPEGEFLAEFALSSAGDLWLWNHGFTGLAMLSYFLFPALGVVLGLLLAGVVRVIELFNQDLEHSV